MRTLDLLPPDLNRLLAQLEREAREVL